MKLYSKNSKEQEIAKLFWTEKFQRKNISAIDITKSVQEEKN